MSVVMLLWPWVRLEPWYLKMSPDSVPSLSGIGRTLPQRVGGYVVGRLDSQVRFGYEPRVKVRGAE
jgi:hypothetical protein